MTENERLKEIRKLLGLTQRQISDHLEIKQGSYSDVERGKAGISAVLLKNLIRKFRVNPLWLCEGEGNMFLDDLETRPSKETKAKANESFRGIRPNQSHPDSLEEQLTLLEQQNDYMENIKSVIDFLQSD